MKNIRKYFKTMIAMLMVGATIGMAAFLTSNKVDATAENTPQEINGYNVAPALGNIPVEVKNIDIHANDVQAELCIEMPTLDPWNPYATLTVDGMNIPNSEVVLLNAKDPQIMKTANRCYLFTFPYAASSSISGRGILKLDKLWVELGRGQLNDSVVAEIRSRLAKVAPGTDFEIVSTVGQGGGGVSIHVTSKPDTMSNDDVIRLIQQLSMDEVSIGWQTEIVLK